MVKQFRKSVHKRIAEVVYMAAGILFGSVLTKKAVQLAYMQRGYVAVGGEWLVWLIVLLIFYFVRSIVQFIISMTKTIRGDDKETSKIIEFQVYVKRQRR